MAMLRPASGPGSESPAALATPLALRAPAAPLLRLGVAELAWCRRCNALASRHLVERTFAVISRLGDGVFWYLLMLALLLMNGQPALGGVVRMLAAGALGLGLYKWLKARTRRPRPCASSSAIRVTVAPLDEYSFPSGHTLHAVAFSIVACAHHPRLVWALAPFALLVAASRLVLGLHYPSDVLAGALLGGLCAGLVLALP